jgi:dynein heavy chain 2
MIDRIREEFSTRSGAALLDADIGGEESLPYSVNFSKTLHQIIWSKSLIGKVKKIQSMI